jgi:4'-phosphopantetheinyl transferase
MPTLWRAAPGDAHDLLRRLGRELLDAAVTIGHRCRHCGSERHGVPTVQAPAGPQLWASLSRAPGLVAAAVSTEGPVGIDLELRAAAGVAEVAAVATHPDEPLPATDEEATAVWVRKEAVLKALGTGLRLDPRTLRLAGDPPAVLAWPDQRPARLVRLEDLRLGGGYQGALAVISGNGAACTQASNSGPTG